MFSWCGWENPSLGLRAGFEASLVTAYAALRPRDGFSHPHQEHMKDTYSPICKKFTIHHKKP